MQDAGVPGYEQFHQLTFDVVATPTRKSAGRAGDVDGHRVAVQVGDNPGVGSVVDRQAEFGGTVARVGDDGQGSERGDVGAGMDPVADEVVIRHLYLVTTGSFYVPVPSPYMLGCSTR